VSRVRSVVVVMCALAVVVALQIVLPVNQVVRMATAELDSPAIETEAVGVACGVAAWACLGWLCIAVVAALLGTLPGRLGALGRRISALSLPAIARPALAGLLGLALLQGGPAAAVAPGHASSGVAVSPNDPPPGASLDWPTPAPTVPLQPAPAERGRSIVRIRAGDTLWDLAAARLGPRATIRRTASEWPRWWAANREVIGSDPDVIRPGEQLIVPRPRT
jgi:hypothetical protein